MGFVRFVVVWSLLLLDYFCVGSMIQFLSVPESFELPVDARLYTSEIGLLNNHLLGFTDQKPAAWHGQGDSQTPPEALAVFLISAPDHVIPELHKVASYQTMNDDPVNVETTMENLKSHFSDKPYTYLDVSDTIRGSHETDLNQMEIVEKAKVKDFQLRTELNNLNVVSKWLETEMSGLKNGVPDFLVFRIKGLLSVVENHGSSASETRKAVQELTQTLEKLVDALKKEYGDNLVIELVSQTGTRQKRAAKTTTTTASPPGKDRNVYKFYSEEYPVAFNIILWTSLFLAITILFIGIGMWNMDPGKDSIIYRMTMSRAKKD